MTTDRYRLGEYETRIFDCTRPTQEDRRLARDLGAGGRIAPRLDIDWLDGGQVKVTTHSWVGVVRLSAMEIQVVPKLVGGNLRVLRMIEYAGGLQLLERLPTKRDVPAEGDDLFDLIVTLLTEETKALVRDGLIRDYHLIDDNLDVLRGRLRVREQVLRRYGQLHRIECAYDEFDGDVAENQLLAAALQAAAPRTRDLDVRNNARTFGGVLNEVCEARSRDADWYHRRIRYGRRNNRYRAAHELAKLVLKGLALTDHADNSTLGLAAFMINMNAIFERFITRLVTDSLAGTTFRARSQQSNSAVILDEATGDTYSNIRPDLLIEDTTTGHKVPVDVKYKLYDDAKKVSTADIYQSFVYAYSAGAGSGDPVAGLLYPATTARPSPSLVIKPLVDAKPARIRTAGIDVPAALDAIGTPGAAALHDRIRTTILELTGMNGSKHELAQFVVANTTEGVGNEH